MEARVRRGAAAGGAAGCVAVAAMYLGGPILGLQPLPALLQEPVLGAMPGPVFGFLIDNLQHLGKVIEEAGLILFVACVFAAAGAVYAMRPGGATAAVHGAALWLLIAAGALPAAGLGLLGLRAGPLPAVGWALLVAIETVLMRAIHRAISAEPAPADAGRRRFLALLPGGVALAGLGITAVRLVPGWFAAVARPPEAAAAAADTAGVTPVESFYVVSKNFNDPVVAEAGWKLRITGSAGRPQAHDLTALRALPRREQLMTLECISNDVGGNQISTGVFAGPSLRDVLATAEPAPGAAWVNMRSRDGYTESLPLATVLGDPQILLALDLAGRRLPDAHGFPARVLIPGRYGMRGPKWLDEIELSTAQSGGYWEAQGWAREAAVKTMSRLDRPRDGDIVGPGAVTLQGIAFAGVRGISRVEYSADGGRTWTAAAITVTPGPLAWVLWSAPWTPPRAGSYALSVRAVDGGGAIQSTAVAPSFPSGSSGLHTIHVAAR